MKNSIYHDCWFPSVDKQGAPQLQHGVIQEAAFDALVERANGGPASRCPRNIEVVVRDDRYGFDSLFVDCSRIAFIRPTYAEEEKILARYVAETFGDKIREADWEVQNLKAKARMMELVLRKVLEEKGCEE